MAKKERNVGVLSKEETKQVASRLQSAARKARLGFIGAGWWATTNHMPLLAARRDVDMASVCGLDRDVLDRCREDFGFQHATTDYQELLRQSLDGVVVASPHTFHAEHAIAALKAGCHVMVEKPFAISARDARQIVTLGKKKNLHVLVPYGWHYRPLGQKARELMEQGPIGRIEFVLCHMASPLKNLMSGRSFDFKDGAYVESNLSTWADARVSGGGYGQAQLSHSLGLMLWLTGLRAKTVYARMSQPGARVDMYDAISVHYKSGAVGTVSGAATLPMGTPGTFQLDLRIFGEDGVVVVDIARDHLSVHTHKGRHETIPLTPGDGAYQCDEPPHRFIELILGLSKQNASPGEVAMRAVEILDAAYRSTKSGKAEKA
jgi:predicted dehydrogenase